MSVGWLARVVQLMHPEWASVNNSVSLSFVPAYVRDTEFLARNVSEKHNVAGTTACMGLRRSVWKAFDGFDQMFGTGRLWEKFCNLRWEYKLGINTRGMAQVPGLDSGHYVPHNYSLIWTILHSLTLSSSDAFVDIGCGKGRVICCAARFDIREATGVEISKTLCEIAERNAIRLSGRRAPITIINTPAQDCDYLNGTVFYLFNPFGALTLCRVLSKIQLSLSAHPRFVRIVYVNPQHESLFQARDWLEMYDRWERGRHPQLAHDISFWKSKARGNLGAPLTVPPT